MLASMWPCCSLQSSSSSSMEGTNSPSSLARRWQSFWSCWGYKCNAVRMKCVDHQALNCYCHKHYKPQFGWHRVGYLANRVPPLTGSGSAQISAKKTVTDSTAVQT